MDGVVIQSANENADGASELTPEEFGVVVIIITKSQYLIFVCS